MGKWWLLLAALTLWLAGGFLILEPPAAAADPGARSARPPVRIVSMAPDLTEILFALGLGERVAGVTQDSDYPPAALAKPKVGTFWQPNIEAVIATRPDLVVTLTIEPQRDLARRLKRIGYDCLAVEIEKIGDLFDAIADIGAAAGVREQTRELSDQMQTAIHRLQTANAGLPKVKVLWVVQREPLRVAGRDTFVNEMIELAGGENAIGPTLHKYPPIGAEEVIAAQPEVIIEPAMLPGALDEQRRQALSYWSRYANVPAVADGRICVIDGDTVSRLGPRLGAGIEVIAKCLRPQLLGE
ncbi:MAG: helical backbone metal receptor [Planctomycetes bacterium]|nr:helical backbone metal receptor [Planctomycetota bacterium]